MATAIWQRERYGLRSAITLLRERKVLLQHNEKDQVIQQLIHMKVGVWDAYQKVSLGS